MTTPLEDAEALFPIGSKVEFFLPAYVSPEWRGKILEDPVLTVTAVQGHNSSDFPIIRIAGGLIGGNTWFDPTQIKPKP